MGTQEDIFLESEGDAWFERNIYKVREDVSLDPVIQMILGHFNAGKILSVLEIGCGNGWRLNELRKIYCWFCYGVDPSLKALENGQIRFGDLENLNLVRGTATAHPFHSGTMNIVIFGFCLYVCDPEDLCEIVAQSNNTLSEEGWIVIHDFDADYPHCVPNHHVDGLKSYKMNWAQLWLSNPAYILVAKHVVGDGTAVWLLKKDQKKAFPEC